MAKSHIEWLKQGENARFFAEEKLILDVTESILDKMDELNVNNSELAQKLGTSKSHVSKLLDGKRNMTLRTLAAVGHVLDQEVKIYMASKGREEIGVDYQNDDWGHGRWCRFYNPKRPLNADYLFREDSEGSEYGRVVIVNQDKAA